MSQSSGGPSSSQESTVSGEADTHPKSKVIKVYARLPPHCPYIGTFHYAPSAKNRSRQNFFRHLIIPEEDIERLHVWKTDAMIGAIVRGSAYYHAQSRSAVFSRGRAVKKRVRAATIIASAENRDSIVSLESLANSSVKGSAVQMDSASTSSSKEMSQKAQEERSVGSDNGKQDQTNCPPKLCEENTRGGSDSAILSSQLTSDQNDLGKYFRGTTEDSILTSISEDEMNELRKQTISPVLFDQQQANAPNHPLKPSPPLSSRPRLQSGPPGGIRNTSSRQRTGSGGSYSLVPPDVLKESSANTDGIKSSSSNLLSLNQLCQSPIRMIGGEEELASYGHQMYQCFLTNDETYMIMKKRMKERAVKQPKKRVLKPLRSPKPDLSSSFDSTRDAFPTPSPKLSIPTTDTDSGLNSFFFAEEIDGFDLSRENKMNSPTGSDGDPKATTHSPARNRPASSGVYLARGRARTIDVALLERADSEPLDTMVTHTQYDTIERNVKKNELKEGEEDHRKSKAGFRTATKLGQQFQRKESFNRRGTLNLKGAVPYVVKDATQLGQYTLQENEEFGEGSFAAVYLATHKETKLKVAIKQIKKRYLFSDEEKASVWREIENHQRASNHRNITSLFEIFETPEYINMVLELADCGDLDRMLQTRRTLSEVEAKRVIKQLLEGLSNIHSTDLVHLDLKPANILFAHDPEVRCDTCGSSIGEWKAKKPGSQPAHTSPSALLLKICDFGLSRKVPDVRYFKVTGDVNKIPFTALTGTEQYMAPEILLKEAYGKPADMWSVGVIMYKLLAGIMPFIPTRACFARKPAFPPYIWDKYSLLASDMVQKLLTLNPSERITSAEALEHPWLDSVYHLQVTFPHFKICPTPRK